jgi:tRNA (cmo5U34)-methyltransferase
MPCLLAATRARSSGLARATTVEADFGTSRWLESVAALRPFDIVVSGFAIHHQPDDRKRSLCAEIFELLAPGGMFLNLDQVASVGAADERIFDEFFIEHLREYHRGSEQGSECRKTIETYFAHKRENLLRSLDVQCHWLSEIGFSDVNCFLKVFELALFGGRTTIVGRG